MKKKKAGYCEWEFSHDGKNRKPHYVKCTKCGRIKRSDLPDIQPCAESNVAYQLMLKKILGQDIDEKDIRDLEKSNLGDSH